MKENGCSPDHDHLCSSEKTATFEKAATSEKGAKAPKSLPQNSPFVGPQSPPLMCQTSPALVSHKSPFLGPQSPTLKSEASPLFGCLDQVKRLYEDKFGAGSNELVLTENNDDDDEGDVKFVVTHGATRAPPTLEHNTGDDKCLVSNTDEVVSHLAVLDPRINDELLDTSEAVPAELAVVVKAKAASTPSPQRRRVSAASLNLNISPDAADKESYIKNNRDCVFIEDIKVAHADTQASEPLQRLLCSTQALWKDAKFGGDCLEFMAKDSELRLTILLRAEPFPDDTEECTARSTSLVGFLVYKLHPKTSHHPRYLSIRRVAVSPAFRRQGYAGELMNWCVRVPSATYLAATSTSRALEFYRAFGFRKVETWHTGGKAHPDDEVELGQVYIEYHPSKKKKGKSR